MGLMTGTGPLAREPAGAFNFEPPAGGALYLEPTAKRIRVMVGGETIADSSEAMILQESGHQPVYYFPPEHVRSDLLEPSDRRTRCAKKGEASYYTIRVGDTTVQNGAWYYPEPIAGTPRFAGLIAFYWNRMDAWFEEDEQVFVHPRDPYHRLDVLRSSRQIRVSLGGELLAESGRPVALFESNLPPRWYLPRDDVAAGLRPSDTITRCGYKGAAHYYSVELSSGELVSDLVWYYTAPLPEAAAVADLLCFFNERVDIEVDGVSEARPATTWSQGVKSEASGQSSAHTGS